MLEKTLNISFSVKEDILLSLKENTEEFKSVMTNLVEMIYQATKVLTPFMPETADKISKVFDFKKEEAGLEGRRLKVSKGEVLFPRREQ